MAVKKTPIGVIPCTLSSFFKLKAVAERRQWSSAAFKPRRNTRVKLYEEIAIVEEKLNETYTRLENIRQQKICGDKVYRFLMYFDKLYDKFNNSEKTATSKSFIQAVNIV